MLFNNYIDELSYNLNHSYIGYGINGIIINHLMYVDDACIIATQPWTLQEIIDICADLWATN